MFENSIAPRDAIIAGTYFEEMNPYPSFSKEYWEREYEAIEIGPAPKIELMT